MTPIEEILQQIATAFEDAPRPANDALLHEQCYDDMDIRHLYGISHWRALPEGLIEREYAALFFLSPAGFRHFLPAYLSFALRYPDGGSAAVDATIFALAGQPEELRALALSKFSLFTVAQRRAVRAFLVAMAEHVNVQDAVTLWQPELPPGDAL